MKLSRRWNVALVCRRRASTDGGGYSFPRISRDPSCRPSSVDAGDYVYISAQGPRSANGALPATFAAQSRQTLNNLKSVVEAAGLTMDHVVYTTVYLTDMSQYGEMNSVFGEYFGKIPPARAVLGVAALPDPPIEINAVAVRSLSDRRAVSPPNYKSDEPFSPGILTHDRLFVSALPRHWQRQGFGRSSGSGRLRARPDEGSRGSGWAGTQPHGFCKSLLDRAVSSAGHEPALCAAGSSSAILRHGRRSKYRACPDGAQIEFTGVAVRDLEKRASGAPQEYAAEPHGESLRLCRRHFILFREEWLYPRTERRSIYFDDRGPTSSDDAQPSGQSSRISPALTLTPATPRNFDSRLRTYLSTDIDLNKMLESVVSDWPMIQDAAIVDADGKAILHTMPEMIGKTVPDRPDFQVVQDAKFRRQLRLIYNAPTTYEVRLPLQLNGEPFGSIRLGISTVFLKREITPRLQHAVIFSGISILLSLLLAAGLVAHRSRAAGAHQPQSG